MSNARKIELFCEHGQGCYSLATHAVVLDGDPVITYRCATHVPDEQPDGDES